jgi:peroxiredoxin
MKRKIAPLFIYILLTLSTSYSQLPDTIIIETERVKGFGPFPSILGFVQEMSKDNPWIPTVPEYKGIPRDFDNLMFGTEQTDFLQHTYQNYFSGKISEEFFNQLKQSWNWHPDEAEYSKEFIKVEIGIVAGYDSEGTLKIKIDTNNNYDFSDDEYFTLPEKIPGQNFWGRYNDLLPFEVTYEFFDGERKKTNAWVYIDYAPNQYNSSEKVITPIQLSFAFAQHHIGEFDVGGKKYTIAIKSDRAVFRDNFYAKVWTEITRDSLSKFDQGIPRNGHIKIGDYYYRIKRASIDGNRVTLIKDKSVEERGGNEVGMRAVNFETESIFGEKIVLEELRGNIVLLDFWGTWCAPCREEIPKLKSIYGQYKNKNFRLIGIANDKLEALNKFVKENNIEWSQIIQENDKSIISDYNVVAYPTTFLIDEEGIILFKGHNANEISEKLAEVFKEK